MKINGVEIGNNGEEFLFFEERQVYTHNTHSLFFTHTQSNNEHTHMYPLQKLLSKIIEWMSRHRMFGTLNRDKRAALLFDIARTHVLDQEHDIIFSYEVCTVTPPMIPNSSHIWEPAQARCSRSLMDSDPLTYTLCWDKDRGEITVGPRYWRRSGPSFRLRLSGDVGGGFAGFTYADCRLAMNPTSLAERLVKGKSCFECR